MLQKQIKFILYFSIIFIGLMIIGLKTIAQPLINLQVNIIKQLFGVYFNYQSFVFVVECSGWISISAFIAVILALSTIKIKINYNRATIYTLLLLIINLIRLIVILFLEKTSIVLAEIAHIVLWFVMVVIIILLIIKSIKKN